MACRYPHAHLRRHAVDARDALYRGIHFCPYFIGNHEGIHQKHFITHSFRISISILDSGILRHSFTILNLIERYPFYKEVLRMDWQAVGARIKAARREKRLTQEQLAAVLDLSTPHISALERGVKPPSLETLILIANELEVSADTLLQDVIDRSTLGAASELSELLSRQEPELQRKILRAVRAMITD